MIYALLKQTNQEKIFELFETVSRNQCASGGGALLTESKFILKSLSSQAYLDKIDSLALGVKGYCYFFVYLSLCQSSSVVLKQ